MMPVMDGSALHKIIKDDRLVSLIPFIFLTAKKERGLMHRSLLDGADGFLCKPFRIKELLMAIGNRIGRFEKIKNVNNNLYSGNRTSFIDEINTPLKGILGFTEILIENQENFKEK